VWLWVAAALVTVVAAGWGLAALISAIQDQPEKTSRTPAETSVEMATGPEAAALIDMGTDTLARRDICYVTVGELHGKTVDTECI